MLFLPPSHTPFEDTRAYLAEENQIKRKEIAIRQLPPLREHQGLREQKVRLLT
jgi:hypothetical protein